MSRFDFDTGFATRQLHALKDRIFNANDESNTLILGTSQNMGIEESGDTSATGVTVGDQGLGGPSSWAEHWKINIESPILEFLWIQVDRNTGNGFISCTWKVA